MDDEASENVCPCCGGTGIAEQSRTDGAGNYQCPLCYSGASSESEGPGMGERLVTFVASLFGR